MNILRSLKKSVVTFFCLLLIVNLSGCSDKGSTGDKNTTNAGGACLNFSEWSYEGYVEKVTDFDEHNLLPSNFLQYESFEKLGEFYRFLYYFPTTSMYYSAKPRSEYTGTETDQLRYYSYDLKVLANDIEYEVIIGISPADSFDENFTIYGTGIKRPLDSASVSEDRLSYTVSDLDGMYRENNIVYYYNAGKLGSIYVDIGDNIINIKVPTFYEIGVSDPIRTFGDLIPVDGSTNAFSEIVSVIHDSEALYNAVMDALTPESDETTEKELSDGLPQGYTKEILSDYLKEVYPETYVDRIYDMSVTKSQDDKYSVYLNLLLNGYRSLSGYIVHIENGKIVDSINNNTDFKAEYLQLPAPKLTQEDMTAAYAQVYNMILDDFPDMSVVDVETDKIFHADTGKYCYHVYITYALPPDTQTMTTVCYPLN